MYDLIATDKNTGNEIKIEGLFSRTQACDMLKNNRSWFGAVYGIEAKANGDLVGHSICFRPEHLAR